MGLGDEIMVSALAKKSYRIHKKPAVILDRYNNLRTNEIWNYNPHIVQGPDDKGAEDVIQIHNGGGCRHYIDYKKTLIHSPTQGQYCFQPWDKEIGDIFFDEHELAIANAFKSLWSDYGKRKIIAVDTVVKSPFQVNKQWPFGHWKVLLDALEDNPKYQLVEFTYPGKNSLLRQEHQMKCHNTRQFVAMLKGCDYIISHEGGLHHAAAALGIPGVVIFGHFISPEITGYPKIYSNIYMGTPDFMGCGLFGIRCPACDSIMQAITPQMVLDKFNKVVHGSE